MGKCMCRCGSELFPSQLSSLLQVVIALGDYLDAQCHACIGGTNVRTDIMKLELGQHVVVGTPGRVFDMISRRALGRIDLFEMNGGVV
jgi:superfamily II DNA/RNA helicase